MFKRCSAAHSHFKAAAAARASNLMQAVGLQLELKSSQRAQQELGLDIEHLTVSITGSHSSLRVTIRDAVKQRYEVPQFLFNSTG